MSHGDGALWEKTGRNPTDRGKPGTKRSLIVDGSGGPLGVVIDGATVPGTKLLDATIEAIVPERPEPTPNQPQHLCFDKGYDNPTGRQPPWIIRTRRIFGVGEEKAAPCGHETRKPRRWVLQRTLAWQTMSRPTPHAARGIQRTLAWLSKWRAILVCYDKHRFNNPGLIQLACALLWFRRRHRLSTA